MGSWSESARRSCASCHVDGYSYEIGRWVYTREGCYCHFCYRRLRDAEALKLFTCFICGKSFYRNDDARECCGDRGIWQFNY